MLDVDVVVTPLDTTTPGLVEDKLVATICNWLFIDATVFESWETLWLSLDGCIDCCVSLLYTCLSWCVSCIADGFSAAAFATSRTLANICEFISNNCSSLSRMFPGLSELRMFPGLSEELMTFTWASVFSLWTAPSSNSSYHIEHLKTTSHMTNISLCSSQFCKIMMSWNEFSPPRHVLFSLWIDFF